MAQKSVDISMFSDRVQRLWERMNPCELCPRKCNVYRSRGEIGYCGVGELPLVSSAGPHFGEESVLVGRGGSGTIFFAGCNLRCVFCQNYNISHGCSGREANIEQLVNMMLDLQANGCSNINFVTPTHVAAVVAAAIESAREQGLNVPIVYNSGGYDSVETLKLLEGLIDIYMPDMKYSDGAVAVELSDAGDYPQINQAAVKEMHRQVGDLVIENTLATRGLLVRHLVLPNNMSGSMEVIDFIADQISVNTSINIMAQYRPCYEAFNHTRINRRPTREEIQTVECYARDRRLCLIP
ncbi:MAG: radical SAM protein [Planctomycetota bacterium]